MASLKEVKNRIYSVKSTRKITSAMKMVASSKLHQAQQRIESMRPYQSSLAKIMNAFEASIEGAVSTPYVEVREVQRVALVVLSSNSSLCGGFNGNVIKKVKLLLEDYRKRGVEVVRIYAIGKKVADALRKVNPANVVDKSQILDHPSYDPVVEIAHELMQAFVAGEIDASYFVYHQFKSAATQVLVDTQFLPIASASEEKLSASTTSSNFYIIEPGVETIAARIFPQVLSLQLYTAVLDSLASEHAARVIAMQVATDNADELLRQLQLQYNKTRQAAITAELLDIVGGSMA